MIVTRAKRLLAIAAVLLGVLVVFAVLRQAADTVLRSATGADPTATFNEVIPAPAEIQGGFAWLPDVNDGRPMEPRTRLMIADALARALGAIDRAGRGDDAAPLSDYLSGPALDAARVAVERSELGETATLHVDTRLRLDFYSDDGSVVAIGVPAAEVVRVTDLPDLGRSVVTTEEAWRLVLILQDGNWRIVQFETVSAAPVQARSGNRPIDGPFAGVNALSAQSGDPTWRAFDPEVAARDLDDVVRLGFDAVRVFVAGPEFGTIDVAALGQFLDLAEAREVDVVPTLFDGSADHSVDRWRDDDDYLDAVVGPFADHPAVAAWDLKNEPDRDDERSGGSDIVDAWLERTAVAVRRLDPDAPVTVGWSAARHAERLVHAVDVVSFHHFTGAEELSGSLEDLVAAVGDRPVVVSELGRPEWVGFVRGSQPAEQARALADLLEASQTASGGSFVWHLRDLDRPTDPGPIASRASETYGLLRADGSERASAAVVLGGRDAVPSPTAVEWLRRHAPWAVIATAALVFLAAGARRARRRRSAGVPAPLMES